MGRRRRNGPKTLMEQESVRSVSLLRIVSGRGFESPHWAENRGSSDLAGV